MLTYILNFKIEAYQVNPKKLSFRFVQSSVSQVSENLNTLINLKEIKPNICSIIERLFVISENVSPKSKFNLKLDEWEEDSGNFLTKENEKVNKIEDKLESYINIKKSNSLTQVNQNQKEKINKVNTIIYNYFRKKLISSNQQKNKSHVRIKLMRVRNLEWLKKIN